ncbi:hypothetical protein T03_2269 [Trichinella britovi]|uniref:Uncharacterized protein n=1 Tax=Trichinella britovi TaxID=45882 RepID=A0A0V1B2T7_TRIBR|nr:hypothetical protein T03_2269 [Trichinella britovi]
MPYRTRRSSSMASPFLPLFDCFNLFGVWLHTIAGYHMAQPGFGSGNLRISKEYARGRDCDFAITFWSSEPESNQRPMDCEYHGVCCEGQIQEACCEQGSFEPIVGRTRGVVLRVS